MSTVDRDAVGNPQCLIGEGWLDGGGADVPVYDPATGTELCAVACADAGVVRDAVSAARDALPGWSATSATERARRLLALAEVLKVRANTLAPVITLDNGKTLTDAQGELRRAIEHLEAAATAPALLSGYGATNVVSDLDVSVLRVPVGVCVVIAPFNFPVMTGLIYHAWALACGNTVVLKPSEQAPVAASAFGGLFAEAGFPPGVFNLVHGGRDVATALIEEPAVAAVSLVGSTASARAVYATAAERGKRVHTAGGARNFAVVLADSDQEGAAAALVASAFGMAGQRCLASTVVVVEESVYDDFVAMLVSRARDLFVGSGFDERTDVPPLISRASVERVNAMVEASLADGAVALLDGREPDVGPGFYVGPTVLAEIDPTGPLITSETFGPLLTALRARSLDQAIELCNGSPFGNAACIFTSHGYAARRFAHEVDAGNIGVNVGVAAPPGQFGFGGRRSSFFGALHSQGREAVEFYTDRKSLTVRWP